MKRLLYIGLALENYGLKVLDGHEEKCHTIKITFHLPDDVKYLPVSYLPTFKLCSLISIKKMKEFFKTGFFSESFAFLNKVVTGSTIQQNGV